MTSKNAGVNWNVQNAYFLPNEIVINGDLDPFYGEEKKEVLKGG